MVSLAELVRERARAEVLNQALLLYAIGSAGRPLNKTQIQKMVFHAETVLRDKKLATPSYRFIRWGHGPWSKDIYDDRDALIARGAVAEHNFSWSKGVEVTSEITKHGRTILEAVVAELEHVDGWKDMKAALENAAAFVRTKNASDVREWSHDLELVPDDSDGVSAKIHDMPDLTVILNPKSWGDSRAFDLDTLENLAYTMSMSPQDLEEIDSVLPEPVTVDELFA